ncbi:bone morphogenetic protein 1 isoform X1 [Lingula anatina]|uniref:Metalloendopeptidase n=2 Tax=Lingula anatina TaxID=7574 RepID=A0A1S3IPW9_LINAN|nr:bone morphogenetic protein 1 isoform X1 [Lingula anatina]|eukprot:XP_013400108.1 bone morphogenetic protein 1 isoform X1 [Lingula anatina]
MVHGTQTPSRGASQPLVIKMKGVFLHLCLVVFLSHGGHPTPISSSSDRLDADELKKLLALKKELTIDAGGDQEKRDEVANVVALLENELERNQELERQAEYKRYLDSLKEGDLHEGDILVDKELLAMLRDDVSDAPAEKRQMTSRPNRKWRKSGNDVIIPYTMAAGGSASYAFQLAINSLRMLTCIKFQARTNQMDYIKVTGSGSSCFSSYGKQGGMQTLNLGNGCFSKGTVLHEILHAVGFFHEQSRPDRDNYVTINYRNIKSGMSSQFAKKRSWEVTTMGQPYDFQSLMHYRNTEFSANGQKTIQAKANPSMSLGNDDLSATDVDKINLFYGCPQAAWRMDDFVIQVRTSSSWFSGTDAKVYMELFWANGVNSGEFPVQGEFERKSVDTMELYLPNESNLSKINIRQDGTGFGSDWKLDRVTIEDKTRSTRYECYCNCWLKNTLAKTVSCRRL